MKDQTKQPPAPYYGGKGRLASRIVKLIPDHDLYNEPFIGGGYVFWAKPSSSIEVINDVNGLVINFYKVLKDKFKALQKLIDNTLYSFQEHQHACLMYKNPELFTYVQLAWAYWVCCCQGFASKICSGWGYEKLLDSEYYTKRLESVYIECRDALKVIQNRDVERAFHYIDPPYPGTSQGHYGKFGFDKRRFVELLELLLDIKGKFILSSYPYPELTQFVNQNGWHQVSFKQTISVNKSGKQKTEVLTANFLIALN